MARASGLYAGLNVSYRVGDDAKIVSQNVCDMKQAVGIHDGRIITMKQIHGDQIIDVKDRNIKEAGEGDGMKTERQKLFWEFSPLIACRSCLLPPSKRSWRWFTPAGVEPWRASRQRWFDF